MERMEKVIDLNDLFPGKVSVQGALTGLQTWDKSVYSGQDVLLRGCAPTWAHLMVAGQLVGIVKSIGFLIDDGKGGTTVEVYRKG